jgi:adenylate kinase
MWLCGAPGSGKGLMTKFIQKLRHISCEPIETSSVLVGPEVDKIKAAGGLVSDRLVLELLIAKLLEPKYYAGVIVDGFPRTRTQGQFISLLFDKMRQLRVKYEGTEHGPKFRRPVFHITVLFVEENVSIERQLMRGRQIIQHNKIAKDAGVGSVLPIRPTDVDVNLARRRYRQFKEHVYE